MTRSIHNIAKSSASAIGDEKSVLVYDSKEYECKLTCKKLIPIMCRIEESYEKWRLWWKYGEIRSCRQSVLLNPIHDRELHDGQKLRPSHGIVPKGRILEDGGAKTLWSWDIPCACESGDPHYEVWLLGCFVEAFHEIELMLRPWHDLCTQNH